MKIAGAPMPLAGALAPTPRPLLERAWVRARIARIIEQRDAVAAKDRDLAAALKKQAIDLRSRTGALPVHLVAGAGDGAGLRALRHRAARAGRHLDGRAAGDRPRHRTEIAAPSAGRAGRPQRRKEPPRRRSCDRNEGAKARRRKGDGLDARSSGDERRRADAEAARPRLPPPLTPRRSATAAAEPRRGARGPTAAAPPARRRGGRHALRSRPSADAGDATPRRAGGPGPVATSGKAGVGPRRPPGRSKTSSSRFTWGGPVKLCRARWPGANPTPPTCWRWWPSAKAGRRSATPRPPRGPTDRSSICSRPRRPAPVRRRTARARAHRRPLALAIDSFRQAVEQRPDHPASHRLLGFALLKAGRPREAFEAIADGVAQRYPAGRFVGVDRILREDLGLLAAAWTRPEPARAAEIRERLMHSGGASERAPSLRFVLNWETDANDVDFHIDDAKAATRTTARRTCRRAAISTPTSRPATARSASPSVDRPPAARRPTGCRRTTQAGPMGYGMGKLEIIDHDGQGDLRFDERPFVIMQDGAFVDLGRVGAPTDGARPVASRAVVRSGRGSGGRQAQGGVRLSTDRARPGRATSAKSRGEGPSTPRSTCVTAPAGQVGPQRSSADGVEEGAEQDPRQRLGRHDQQVSLDMLRTQLRDRGRCPPSDLPR